jgi:hypothetical protein
MKSVLAVLTHSAKEARLFRNCSLRDREAQTARSPDVDAGRKSMLTDLAEDIARKMLGPFHRDRATERALAVQNESFKSQRRQ